MWSRAVVAAVAYLCFAAPALAQQSGASAQAQQAFDELRTKYEAAYNKKDVAGVLALYARDAVEVEQDGIYAGRDQIAKWLERQFRTPCGDLSISRKQLQASGDAVRSAGEWTAQCQGERQRGYWALTAVRDSGALAIQQLATMRAEQTPRENK
jgi:uncharacterized protein (TIGR02246 family)